MFVTGLFRMRSDPAIHLSPVTARIRALAARHLAAPTRAQCGASIEPATGGLTDLGY